MAEELCERRRGRGEREREKNHGITIASSPGAPCAVEKIGAPGDEASITMHTK